MFGNPKTSCTVTSSDPSEQALRFMGRPRTSQPPSCVARSHLDEFAVLHAVNGARELLEPIARSGRIAD
jgi:hypothetical protein